MNIIAWQWDSIWQDTQANLDALAQQLSELCRNTETPVDVVVLPEVFLSGFSMQPVEFSEAVDGPLVAQLQSIAKLNQIYLVLGLATKERVANNQSQHFNSALVIDRDGQIISHYRKQKLFAYAKEHLSYQAGNQAVLFEMQVNDIKIKASVFICYDLRFPELFREVARQVDMIFIIASWPQSRQMHWEILLKARAIENQCFIVGVNRIGVDGNQLQYGGGSMVISPLGEVLAYGDAETSWLQQQIDLTEVVRIRQQFPFLEDM